MAKYIDENGFAHFLGKLKTLLDGKVNTESGKGLSTNDYTTAEKNKLAGIAANANNYSLPTASADTKGGVKIGAGLTMTGEVLSADVQSVPVMTGATSSAAGTAGLVPAPASGIGPASWFLRADGNWAQIKLQSTPVSNGLLWTLTSEAGSNNVDNIAGFTVYTGEASTSAKGLMSAADKSKLDAFGAASTYALKSDITSMYKHKGSVSSTSNLPSSGQTEGDVYNVTATGMNYVWTGSEWDALGEIFTINSMTTTEIDAAFVTAGLTAA